MIVDDVKKWLIVSGIGHVVSDKYGEFVRLVCGSMVNVSFVGIETTGRPQKICKRCKAEMRMGRKASKVDKSKPFFTERV